MIVSSNRIPVAKGFEKNFEDRFKNRSKLVDNMPGFIENKILKPIDSDYYVVLTFWESIEDFKAWTTSEAFAKAHSKPISEKLYAGASVPEVFEVIGN